jgi:hypothetical protein
MAVNTVLSSAMKRDRMLGKYTKGSVVRNKGAFAESNENDGPPAMVSTGKRRFGALSFWQDSSHINFVSPQRLPAHQRPRKSIAMTYQFVPVTSASPALVSWSFLDGQRILRPHNMVMFNSGKGEDVVGENNASSSGMATLVRRNGPLVWKTYWGVYFGSLGAVFLGLQSGLVNPSGISLSARGGTSATTGDVLFNFLKSRPRLTPYSSWIKSHPMVANLAVAWLVTEACEPIRIGATCVLVPLLSRDDWRQQEQGQRGAM